MIVPINSFLDPIDIKDCKSLPGNLSIKTVKGGNFPYLSKSSEYFPHKFDGIFLTETRQGHRSMISGGFHQEIYLAQIAMLSKLKGHVVLVGSWSGCALQQLLKKSEVTAVTLIEPITELWTFRKKRLTMYPNIKKLKYTCTGDIYFHLTSTLKDLKADFIYINMPRPLPSLSSWLMLYTIGRVARENNVIKSNGHRVLVYGRSKLNSFIKEEEPLEIKSRFPTLGWVSFPTAICNIVCSVKRACTLVKKLPPGEKNFETLDKYKAKLLSDAKSLDADLKSDLQNALDGAPAPILEKWFAPALDNYLALWESTRLLPKDQDFLHMPDKYFRVREFEKLVWLFNQFAEALELPPIPAQGPDFADKLRTVYYFPEELKDEKDSQKLILNLLFPYGAFSDGYYPAALNIQPASYKEWPKSHLGYPPPYLETDTSRRKRRKGLRKYHSKRFRYEPDIHVGVFWLEDEYGLDVRLFGFDESVDRVSLRHKIRDVLGNAPTDQNDVVRLADEESE